MKSSDLFVKSLETEGVTHVFGVPGEETEDLLFSLADSSIAFIPTRHESGASFMANVHGRVTGRAGVCLSTLGPGATNLLTGVADAHLDKAPIVAITGQGGLERLHKESHQLIDAVRMFAPITKWNTSIRHSRTIPEVVRKAFKLAEMEKPGAAHIELPEDIAKMETTGKPIKKQILRRSAPDKKALDLAWKIIKQSKRPIIIAGNGAVRKRVSRHLREFVEKTKIPAIATFMGKGAISDRSSYSLFTLGYKQLDYVHCAIASADAIITIGYDIAEHSPDSWNPEGKKQIIHIDFTPAEVYDRYNPNVEVISDIAATLSGLNKKLEKEQLSFNSKWYESIRQTVIQDIESYNISEQAPFSTPSILPIIREHMRDQDILISDVGSHKIWIARNYPAYEPNTCIISNGLASMGISLPGAIAAKLAHPQKRVVSVSGDGGFMMNSQEIATAKQLGIGFTIIVLNDDSYGLIEWKQKANKSQSFGTKLLNPNFKAYAESFGIMGYSPSTQDELRKTLARTIESQELSLVEIKVESSVNAQLDEKLNQNSCAILVPEKA